MSNTTTSTETLTVRIDGMSCAHCVRAVRDALAEVPGVTVQRVEIGGATVAFDPTQQSPTAVGDAVTDAVRDAGYEPAVA